jgi:ATP-dependent DNA helicase 2 subunit 2
MLGFTDIDKVPRQHYMAGCDIVVPVESSTNRRAFSALINAMIETDKVMIAKWISRKNSAPKLVVLHPYHTPKFECLYMNVLPTVEDIRDYQFGSLQESTEGQQQAMDEFVDALDLDEVEREEGVESDVNVYNPTLQYFNQ